MKGINQIEENKMSVGRQDFGERKETRIDNYKSRARKANIQANEGFESARNMGSVIPLGQPILRGHHSEGKHRALLKKMDNAQRKASEELDKASYYEQKAQSAENNHSISGDDPEAVERYQQKLVKLEKLQEFMKAVNRARKKGKTALIALGLSETEIEKVYNKQSQPFPSWELTNNGAEIRRIKSKLEEFKKLDCIEAERIKFNGGEMLINTEINRVQILFDDIPEPEKRKLLKSHGFKWSPKEKAWQRQRTLNAIKTAKYLLQEYFNK